VFNVKADAGKEQPILMPALKKGIDIYQTYLIDRDLPCFSRVARMERSVIRELWVVSVGSNLFDQIPMVE